MDDGVTAIGDMGKYGPYVWSSVSLMIIVIVACVVQARSGHKKMLASIEARLRAMESTE